MCMALAREILLHAEVQEDMLTGETTRWLRGLYTVKRPLLSLFRLLMVFLTNDTASSTIPIPSSGSWDKV